MIIIWGKKVARADQGVVARFCPVCRTVTAHRVTAIFLVPHVYYITAGRGKRQHTECTCRACGVVFFGKGAESWVPLPSEAGKSFGPETPQTVLCELAVATGAEDPEELLARLELEDRQRAGGASADERRGLIMELLASLEYMCTLRATRSAQQSVTAVLQLMLIVGLIGSAISWGMLYLQRTPRTGVDLGACVLATVVTGIVAVVVARRMLRGTKAAAQKYVMGSLHASLAALTPLPREDEVESALEVLRSYKLPMAGSLTGAEVVRGLAAGGAGSGQG